jgi:hypothetical protein
MKKIVLLTLSILLNLTLLAQFKGKMGKALVWNGILMLLDMKMMGHSSHQEATSIQVNMPVAAEYFIIPENIKFSEMPGF